MKMTERDKVLLVLLGVILIVALAVVMPGVGVLSCRDSIAEYENDSQELEAELDTLRDELSDMGVDPLYYDRHTAAKEKLESKIWELKKEASHLAGAIMAYAKPYAVDESWVDGLEYRYGVTSDDSEKIVSYSAISDVESIESNSDIYFDLEDTNYTLPSAKREIRFTTVTDGDEVSPTPVCTYETELVFDDCDVRDLGDVLLFLHNISAKGSILITDFTYSTSETQPMVAFTLLMPKKDSGIKDYANEIRAAEEAEEGEEEDEE